MDGVSGECFCCFVVEVDWVVDGTGATSLAMRASINVTKVNETLCAGEYARLSRTHACVSSQDRGGALDFSLAIICCSISCQTDAVTMPSLRELRKVRRVSQRISSRWRGVISGAKVDVRELFVSRDSRTEARRGARSSGSCNVHVWGRKGQEVPYGSFIQGASSPDSPFVMLHSATARSVNSEIDSVSLNSSRGADSRTSFWS